MGGPALLRPGGLLARLGELSGLVYRPMDEEPVPVVERAPCARPEAGSLVRVACWNIQFAGTRRQKFFYDGGEAVRVPPEDRERGLTTIGSELRALDADIVLLQELDRDSDRTSRVDQLEALLARAPYPRFTSASCHRSRYVPHPPKDHLGRVDLHVALLSRVGLQGAVRHQLPLLREPRLRRAFNLKRCLLSAVVPVRGWTKPLHLAVTHLSAFSRGDGTLLQQVAVLRSWMEARERAGEPFVLGGDLNLLPPGDDPHRLGAEAVEYGDHPNPIEALIPRFRSVVPPGKLLEADARTYMPWGAPAADRVLDYLFTSASLDVIEAGPVARPDPISDHHPLLAVLRLPESAGAA